MSGFLTQNGIKHIITSDTKGTEYAKHMRDIVVKQQENGNVSPKNHVLMLMSARVDVVENIIKPNLENGKWVLCDRFTDSGLAYQGYAEENIDIINNYQTIIKFSLGTLEPDITFLLDISVNDAINRMKLRNDGTIRFEGESEYLDKLRNGFMKIAADNIERINVISAHGSIDDIHKKVVQLISPFVNINNELLNISKERGR